MKRGPAIETAAGEVVKLRHASQVANVKKNNVKRVVGRRFAMTGGVGSSCPPTSRQVGTLPQVRDVEL